MYIHSDCKRFMFTVKPAMDKFLLDAAKQLGINLKNAGYPATLEAFKKETLVARAQEIFGGNL